jgi:hypothetical protein
MKNLKYINIYLCEDLLLPNYFVSVQKNLSPSYPAYFEGQYLTTGMVKYSLLPLKEGGMTGRQCLLARLPQEIRVISVSPGELAGPKKYVVGRDLPQASRSKPIRG